MKISLGTTFVCFFTDGQDNRLKNNFPWKQEQASPLTKFILVDKQRAYAAQWFTRRTRTASFQINYLGVTVGGRRGVLALHMSGRDRHSSDTWSFTRLVTWARAYVSAAFVAHDKRMFSALCVPVFLPLLVGVMGRTLGSCFTETFFSAAGLPDTVRAASVGGVDPDRRLCLSRLGRLRCSCTGLRARRCRGKNLETHGKKGQNRKCRDVVSLRVCCRCVALCGGYCGKEVEMPGPAIPFPRTPRRHTESRSSPKWTETNTVFWKTNVAQTTDISKIGFSCRSSSSPRGYLMSRADCALRGVAGFECATLPNMEIAAF